MAVSNRTWRLDGIARKLDRAIHDMNALIEEINAHIKAHPARTTAEIDTEESEVRIRVHFDAEADTLGWGLQVGRILYGVRSALDNLFWHLALKVEDSPSDPRKIYFPIRNDPLKFKKPTSVEPCPAAIIEWAQPFQRRHAPDLEPLWLLNQLGNADKHRVISPALVVPDDFNIEEFVADPDITKVFVEYPPDPLEDGAVAMIFRTDNPGKVHMKGQLTSQIVIDLTTIEGCPDVRVPLDNLLESIAKEATTIVNLFSPYI